MKRRAVFVRWRDAADHTPGEWAEAPKNPDALITTVAILIAKTRHNLVIAQSFDDNDDPLYRGLFTIPRSAVIELRELTEKE